MSIRAGGVGMMKGVTFLFAAAVFIAPLGGTWAMYCGDRNCYDVLKVKENADKTEIINSYRKLAREWHPDKNKHRAAVADKEFSAIAHAYDILKDDVSRRDYDYALRHPELFAYNQAKYFYTQFYSRHVKFNPIMVLLIALIAWSAFDYSARLMSHKRAIRIYKESPEYKIALKRFKEEKVLEMEKEGLIKKKMNGKRTKKELDAIPIDEKELEDQIQVHGSYRKPEYRDLAIIQFWFIPYYIYKSVAWHVRWLRRYQFGNEEYTLEDKEYIVRGVINMSQGMWDALTDKQRSKIMVKELWIPENEAKYRESQRMQSDDFHED